jgi:hypothetical protein
VSPPPADLPPPVFYQAVAAIFAVLLLSGVVTELRALDAEATARPVHRRFAAFAALFLVLLAGEIVTLEVLVDPPVRHWQHLLITVTLIAGLVGVPAMTFAQALQRLTGRARLGARIGGGVALLVLVALAALLVRMGEFGGEAFQRAEPYPTYVYGTCAAGPKRCGLHVHMGPDGDTPSVGRLLKDTTRVYVVCQKRGGLMTAVDGTRSRIWDLLSSGGWVSDLYLLTPGEGDFSPQIERCS